MQRQKVDWRDGNRQSKSFFFLGTESRAEFTIWLLEHLVNLKSRRYQLDEARMLVLKIKIALDRLSAAIYYISIRVRLELFLLGSEN